MRAGFAIATLFARTSARPRAFLASAIAFAVGARLAVIVAALEVARNDAGAAAVAGVVAAVLYALERAVTAVARTGIEGDLHRMTARALLASDVLAVPSVDLSRVIYDGAYHGLQLLVGIVPALVADGVVSLVALPIVVTRLPARLVILAVGALVIVTVGTFVVRRATHRLERRALDAYQALADTIAVTLEGRLEVVARGGEDELMRALELRLRAYERVSVRAAYGAALLARVPLGAATATVAIVALADPTSRSLLTTAILGQALVLVTGLRPVLGAIMGLHGAARTLTFVKPFVDLVARPARADVGVGGAAPSLPAPLSAHDLAFGYEPESPVFSRLSFSWSGEQPLVVVGPNGSGKSTLLRLILGLRAPTAGSLRLGGKELATLDLPTLRRNVAYLPQRSYLGEAHMTVRAAMKLGCADASDDTLRRALDQSALVGTLDPGVDPLEVSVGELSAGQRQRVALARIVLNERAKMVLLDEPDANLDREGIALVGSLVRELAAAGKMVIVIAHTRDLIEIPSQRLEIGP